MALCTRAHSHCCSTSHPWGSRCHQNRTRHTSRLRAVSVGKHRASLKHPGTVTLTQYSISGLEAKSMQQPLRKVYCTCPPLLETEYPTLYNSPNLIRCFLTESRGHTDSSAGEDAALVVPGTVFITDTGPLGGGHLQLSGTVTRLNHCGGSERTTLSAAMRGCLQHCMQNHLEGFQIHLITNPSGV